MIAENRARKAILDTGKSSVTTTAGTCGETAQGQSSMKWWRVRGLLPSCCNQIRGSLESSSNTEHSKDKTGSDLSCRLRLQLSGSQAPPSGFLPTLGKHHMVSRLSTLASELLGAPHSPESPAEPADPMELRQSCDGVIFQQKPHTCIHRAGLTLKAGQSRHNS